MKLWKLSIIVFGAVAVLLACLAIAGIPPITGSLIIPGVDPHIIPGVDPHIIPGVDPHIIPGVDPHSISF
ncbi:MAG TPA: hypothetical protein VLH13_00210 [Methanomassiliicoccales archaeon]|nr:hypothetical protein [Methanomassiliicoccales archaeon]